MKGAGMGNVKNKGPEETLDKNPEIVVTKLCQKDDSSKRWMEQECSIDSFRGESVVAMRLPVTESRALSPDLTLMYGSRQGNDIFGMGFYMPVPSISRDSRVRIPDYVDETDSFTMSVNGRLNLVSRESRDDQGEIWHFKARCEKEFQKIEYHRNKKNSFWKTIDSQGTIIYYGEQKEEQIYDEDCPQRVCVWMVSRMIDLKGNQIEYSYNRAGANLYLKSIFYGNYRESNDVQKFMFEVAFDYKDDAGFIGRRDVQTSYRYGFRVETGRLCRRIRMIHHLKDKDLTVKDTFFVYQEDKVSLLKEIRMIGYSDSVDGKVRQDQMPPISFGYTKPVAGNGQWKEVQFDGYEVAMPQKNSKVQLLDLYGEGTEGILSADAQGIWYYEAKGNGYFSGRKLLKQFPLERNLGESRYEMISLDGSGTYQMVVNETGRHGYYEEETGEWNGFIPFENAPPEIQKELKEMTDLQGDGLAHMMIKDPETVCYYPSIQKKGFSGPVQTEAPIEFPFRRGSEEANEYVGFHNILGDGCMHLIRVRNGCTEMWPNLGYGKFGSPTVISGGPFVENDFQAENLYFADLDGSGAEDMIYVRDTFCTIYWNQGEKGWQEGERVQFPETMVSPLSAIQFGNLLGKGNSVLLLSKGTDSTVHWFYDFIEGEKPYLLNKIGNGRGLEINISYTTSSIQCLKAKEEGNPWTDTTPFPVWMPEIICENDRISGIIKKTSYQYRNGVYDVEEKHFMGFGQVETREEIQIDGRDYISQGISLENCKKTCYYTGHAPGQPDIEIDSEFFSPNMYRSLYGKQIQEELYVKDGQHTDELREITSYRYKIKQTSDKDTFYGYEVEKKILFSEKGKRMSQEFSLEVDDYGNILKKAYLYYPKIGNIKILVKETDYTWKDKEEQKVFFVFQEKELEIGGISKETYLTEKDIRAYLLEASQAKIPYGENFNGEKPQERMTSWKRHFYWKENRKEVLPLGEADLPGLCHHKETAVFSDGYIETAAEFMEQPWGYHLKEGYWWKQGIQTIYASEEEWFLPISEGFWTEDEGSSLCSKTDWEYDAYRMMPITEKKWVSENSQIKRGAKIDYRTMKYCWIEDENCNVTWITYNGFGNVLSETVTGICQGETQTQTRKYDYDFLAFHHHGTPVCITEERSINYDSEDMRTECSYLNGTGCEILRNVKTENAWRVKKLEIFLEKEKPVMIFAPFLSEEPAFAFPETTQRIPEIHEYDGLKRKTRILKPEGISGKGVPLFLEHRWVYGAWEEVEYDENSTLEESSYYQEFIGNYPQYPELWQEDQKKGMEKGLEFSGNYIRKTMDCMGNCILQENGEGWYGEISYDIKGHIVSVANQKMAEQKLRNHKSFYDMEGVRVKTESCDSGTSITIHDCRENPVFLQKNQDIPVITEYDGLNRMCCKNAGKTVERYVYGETAPQPEQENLNGRLWIQYDQSGITRFLQYDISGNVRTRTYQLCKEYETEIDWDQEVSLEEEVFEINDWYGCDGNLLKHRYQDGSYTEDRYNIEGMLAGTVQYDEVGGRKASIDQMEYDTFGNLCRKTYGNHIQIINEYDPISSKLKRSGAKRPDGSWMKNQCFSYDGTGRVTRIRDMSCGNPAIYRKGQKAPPYLDYTYDNLYRLKQAVGREMPMEAEKTDLEQLEEYVETYSYDTGNNLAGIYHKAASQAWNRDIETAEISNHIRKVYGQETEYDQNGNPVQIPGMGKLFWNFDGKLKKTVLVSREREDDDCEFYVYDSSGVRKRKVRKRKKSENLVEVTDILYLDGYERKRVYQEGGEGRCIVIREAFEKSGNNSLLCAWYREDTGKEKTEEIRYCIPDHTGSMSVELDEEGRIRVWEEYRPFGERAWLNTDQVHGSLSDYGFSGKRKDESTGFYDFESRYYVPIFGRMLSCDGTEYCSGENLRGWNPYVFCFHDPINHMDSDGHWPTWLWIKNHIINPVIFGSFCFPWVKSRTNCYAYAMDMKWNPLTGNRFPRKPQPGEFSGGTVFTAAGGAGLIPAAAAADMTAMGYTNTLTPIAGPTAAIPANTWRVALVATTPGIGTQDYHWYRQNPTTGNWTHKPGTSAVKSVDATGNSMNATNPPDIANRDYSAGGTHVRKPNYNQFIGYFYVGK